MAQTRPFLSRWIQSLEYVVINTRFVISRLEELGLPEELISRYIIFSSRRPRTDMRSIITIPIVDLESHPKISSLKLFSSPNPILVSTEWLNKIVEVHQESLVPVIRYGQGIDKGTYYKESP